MKFATASSLALATFLQAAKADFYLYAAGIGGNGIAGNAWGYQVYGGDTVDCDNVIDWIWRSSDDVSGGKYGVRCKGPDDSCDSSGDPTGLEELEMNFNSDDFHWSKSLPTWRYHENCADLCVCEALYANRDWALVDLDGNQVGSCETVADGSEFFCGAGLGRAEGQLKVHCTTDSTADDINGNKPT